MGARTEGEKYVSPTLSITRPSPGLSTGGPVVRPEEVSPPGHYGELSIKQPIFGTSRGTAERCEWGSGSLSDKEDGRGHWGREKKSKAWVERKTVKGKGTTKKSSKGPGESRS